MDYGLILAKNFSGKKWTVSGDGNYEDIVWQDESKKPSKKELDAMWEEVKTSVHNEKMRDLRRYHYQLEADPLFFDFQRGEASKEDWLNKIAEIKEKFQYIAIS